MNPHQQAELAYWRHVFEEWNSAEAYCDSRRVRDLRDSSFFMPEIHHEQGRGLDLCCGLVSMLEGLPPDGREIWAVDALMDEYDQIYRSESAVKYQKEDGEALSFETDFFDFVWAVNCIDHTPNPERMVAEIRRVLKPGGRLYMWVNFDRPPLSPCHYDLWHWGMVEKYFAGFHLLRAVVAWSEQWRKHIYFGIYENRK